MSESGGRMMESVDKLRELGENIRRGVCEDSPSIIAQLITANAENIEHEIERNYMRLPVDADGVPIHLGDMMLKSTGAPKPSYGEVAGISDDSVFFRGENCWESNWASLTRHYHAPTVEDLLYAYGQSCIRAHEEAESDDAKREMLASLRKEFEMKLREVLRDE